MSFYKYYFVLSLFLIGCSGQQSLQNLNLSKMQIQRYYEEGEYRKELSEVVNKAMKQLSNLEVGTNSAAVFDVDETTLDNYSHIKEVDFGYVIPLWNQWIEEKRAPAIAEVKRVYDFFIDKGVKIIFLTGRREFQYETTYENLKSVGYSTFDTLITKSNSYSGTNAIEYKSEIRTRLTEMGYNIIASVGDQWSDLEGPHAGIKIKLPNYLYWIE